MVDDVVTIREVHLLMTMDYSYHSIDHLYIEHLTLEDSSLCLQDQVHLFGFRR
jgi:hypothetical protein